MDEDLANLVRDAELKAIAHYIKKGLSLMADAVDQLQEDFNSYKAAVDSAFTTVDAAITDLQATVQQLRDSGTADQATVASLDAQVNQAKDAVAAEQAKVAAADPGAAAPAAPAGTAAPPPAAPPPVTGDPGTAPPPPAEPPPAEPAPAAPAAPDAAATVERSVYTFDGDPATIDHNMWPDSGFVTTDTPPRTLYYFSGDVNPGDTAGDNVGGQWHLYTGTRVPATA